jgi:hypothetical protein
MRLSAAAYNTLQHGLFVSVSPAKLGWFITSNVIKMQRERHPHQTTNCQLGLVVFPKWPVDAKSVSNALLGTAHAFQGTS